MSVTIPFSWDVISSHNLIMHIASTFFDTLMEGTLKTNNVLPKKHIDWLMGRACDCNGVGFASSSLSCVISQSVKQEEKER